MRPLFAWQCLVCGALKRQRLRAPRHHHSLMWWNVIFLIGWMSRINVMMSSKIKLRKFINHMARMEEVPAMTPCSKKSGVVVCAMSSLFAVVRVGGCSRILHPGKCVLDFGRPHFLALQKEKKTYKLWVASQKAYWGGLVLIPPGVLNHPRQHDFGVPCKNFGIYTAYCLAPLAPISPFGGLIGGAPEYISCQGCPIFGACWVFPIWQIENSRFL